MAESEMSRAFRSNDNYIPATNTSGHTPSDESKILAWLSPLEPWVRHRDIASQRVDGVGDWLLETDEFRRWRNGNREDESDHATLFCYGNPGAGKSHITSLVIDKLCDEALEGDTAVACFYFDFAFRNEQSPINMLGFLLRQLVSGFEEIPEAVAEGFRNRENDIGGRGLQVSGILKMLQTIIATKRTFIIVDALDECVPEHRMVVLESLAQILQGSPNTRIFMAGKPHVRSEVERSLNGAAAFISIRPTEDDIVRYLREKLRNDTTPEMMNSTLEENIMKSIPKICSETFLLASLYIENILREATIARRAKRLKSMDDWSGLEGAYGATLERIKAQNGEKAKLAMATLTWICHSERPLQLDELCYALAVEIGAADFDPENIPSISTLLSCCQGLIAVDKEASTVRVIHFTLQEYLCTQPDLFRKPHSIIAEACLTYLNSQQVKNLSSHPLPGHQSAPFLEYSSRYWGTHANRELSDHANTLALQLLNKYEDHVSAASLLKQVLHPNGIGDIGSPRFSGLHCASFFGIVELVIPLIKAKDCEINQQDCADSTPLSWTAKNGHEEVVRILLERKDVDPNLPDKNDRTPLGCAAATGHEGVAKLLLGRDDVNPNKLDKLDLTPLFGAAQNGHEGVVKILLERGDINPSKPNRHGQTPLWHAALNGREGVVKMLLEQGNANPDIPDNRSQTALYRAAWNGHEGVVRILLGRDDVNPDTPDVYGQTPLFGAALNGNEGVVKILLTRENIKPAKPNKYGQTPLFGAAENGHEGVVKILLGRDEFNPDKPDNRGQTPLYRATWNGHEGVVKILLGREDVNPDKPDVYGQTPLFGAAENGHEGVVKILLEQGDVNPNKPNKYGRTPLFGAAWDGHEGVVKILLARDDVNPDKPDKLGRTALWWATKSGHAGVVALLQHLGSTTPNTS